MAKFKIGDKVRSKDYPDAGVMTITQIGQDVHGTTYRTKWENGSVPSQVFYDSTLVAANSTPASMNAVVSNALTWRARNARDADGKELKIGDKIKVQTDMHGRWDGSGVVTALKPYGIVDYKDVFGHINTTQENSVRVVNAVATNAFYKTEAEAERQSQVFLDGAIGRIRACVNVEIGTVEDCIKLFKGAPMSDKAKENLERLNAHLLKLKRCKAMF